MTSRTSGIGGLVLQSQGYSSNETQHTVQLSDTQVLGSHMINETHFQFIRDDTSLNANQFGAAINVLGEFSGGGSTIGQNSDRINRYELQNYTSWAVGKHFVKFGGRLRAYQDTSIADTNYQRHLYLQHPVNALHERQLPRSISVVIGSPRTALAFADVGLYAEDDWKLRPESDSQLRPALWNPRAASATRRISRRASASPGDWAAPRARPRPCCASAMESSTTASTDDLVDASPAAQRRRRDSNS